MSKLRRAVRRSRANSEFYLLNRGNPTPNVNYKIKIKPHKIVCKVGLPEVAKLNLTDLQTEALKQDINRALERVLARFFT